MDILRLHPEEAKKHLDHITGKAGYCDNIVDFLSGTYESTIEELINKTKLLEEASKVVVEEEEKVCTSCAFCELKFKYITKNNTYICKQISNKGTGPFAVSRPNPILVD